MIDRLLLIASFLLIVITVIFAQFMNAEKFWQGKAVDLEIKLVEKSLSEDSRKQLEVKREEFYKIHLKQKMYGRIFGGLAGLLLFVNAFCLPIGKWKNSSRVVKSISFIFVLGSICLGIVALSFAFNFWSP